MTARPPEPRSAAASGTFKCHDCGNIYEKEWSDEEAAAELEKAFGTTHQPDDAELCDECYAQFMEAYR